MGEQNLSVDPYGGKNPAYEYLRKKIITMTFAPGTKVSENKISAELQIGRPLVREGFSRLEEEGYIEVYPQSGTRVSHMNMEKIRQGVEVHKVFEQAIAREVAEKGLTQEQERQIQEALYEDDKGKNEDDAWQIIMIEQKLWYLLAKFCDKQYIWNVYRGLDCDLYRLYHMQYSTYGYRSVSYSLTGAEYARVEGKMLIDNIKRGDADAAALVCTNRLSVALMNAEALQKIYPSYFTE